MRFGRFARTLLMTLTVAVVGHVWGAEPAKVLRYAFPVAETGFDPAQVNDTYSRIVAAHIFEGLYRYDHLARPAKIVPLLADGMPVVSDDFKTWTVKVKPGIFFASDPAFKGKKREVVAEDFVYTMKRFADPKLKSSSWTYWDSYDFTGLRAQRQRGLDAKQPFDYDAVVEGVRTLDKYTIQFTLGKSNPRFLQAIAQFDLYGAIAREVAEAYGEQIPAHPVGTGPFRLGQWRRSSLIVLERNPDYREVRYDGEPAADDAVGQALLRQFKGRKLPMIDRVEVSIIEETQPRWLSFVNRQHDYIDQLPPEYMNVAMPNGNVAPNLRKLGVKGYRTVRAEVALITFNMEHPTVGGMSPAKVALRRAINLGLNVEREIRLARHSQAVPAQSPTNPHTTGFDANLKSEMSDYSPARAKALLDLYGYTDKDGDGWRDMPDGSPLRLEMNTQPDGLSRKLDELRKKDMDAIGIRMDFASKKWPENLKAARAGNFMMWGVGSVATAPDGASILQRYDGRQIGSGNLARFKLPAFDVLYDRISVTPDGPERLAMMAEANRIAVAYAPYKATVHRIITDMTQPWLLGYRRPVFWNYWWHMIDIDAAMASKDAS